MSPRLRCFAWATVLVLAGCAGPGAVQPVAAPFAVEPAPPPPPDPLRALELLAADPANRKIVPDLTGLALAETDQRCRAFLEAGSRAWLAECRDAARMLWGLALDRGPVRSVCLPVGDTHALFVHRPLDGGEMPALGETGAMPAKHAFPDFAAVGLGAVGSPGRPADLSALVESVVPPPADGCVVVRGAHALELLPRARLAARAIELARFARLQQGVAIAFEVRWIRFPIAVPDGSGSLFDTADGRELDRAELERLRTAHGGEVVCAPRLTAFPGQTANIAIVRTVPYIADFELLAGTSGALVADPVIGTAVAGQTVTVCAVVVAPDAIAMHIVPSTCEVGEPIPELEIALGGLADPVTIQLPRTTRYSLSRFVRIPQGRTRWLPVGLTCDAQGVRHRIGIAIEARTTPLSKPTPASPPGK